MSNSDLQLSRINAMKFEYEFMGKDVPELAQAYGFNQTLIEQEIQSGHWKRRIEPTALPDTSDIEQFAKQLETVTRSKLSIISLFRQIDQQPLIAQLEKTFLEKAQILATELDPTDEKATNKLINLVKSIAAIQDRNPINLADQLKEDNRGSGLTVQIANYGQTVQ